MSALAGSARSQRPGPPRPRTGTRPFLIDSAITIADIACCAYLYWPEQAGLDLARWPNVVAWLERISTLPGWAEPYDLLKS